MPSFAPVAGFPLAELISGVMIPESLRNAVVTSLHIDSRAVAPGGLFIAVPGYEADGRTYIAQALAAGAVAVLAEAEGLAEPGEKVIPVADLRRKVSDIAGRFYGNPSKTLRVTGITGTNGKTTCAHLYGQLMSLLDAKTAMIGTLGFG
ncbi:MAG: Mur ligase domain-containing protein, partial [bacterium]